MMEEPNGDRCRVLTALDRSHSTRDSTFNLLRVMVASDRSRVEKAKGEVTLEGVAMAKVRTARTDVKVN
jgi:hypothetical protein